MTSKFSPNRSSSLQREDVASTLLNQTLTAPELLAPAGSLRNMRYAFAYGADAVYAGQPRYSLRVRNNEFSLENLAIGIKEAHALGKKFYVVSNIAPHNSKLGTYLKDISPVIAMKPDALIMSDPGLIMMVRDAFPEMPIHLSVQANAVNYATVKFWQKQGIERVILSRELSLEEIETIRVLSDAYYLPYIYFLMVPAFGETTLTCAMSTCTWRPVSPTPSTSLVDSTW